MNTLISLDLVLHDQYLLLVATIDTNMIKHCSLILYIGIRFHCVHDIPFWHWSVFVSIMYFWLTFLNFQFSSNLLIHKSTLYPIMYWWHLPSVITLTNFHNFLIHWPLSPSASCFSWCRPCFGCSGLTYKYTVEMIPLRT